MKIPGKIELSVDETYTLEFPGLGTSGYLWTYEILEGNNIVGISVERNSTPLDEGKDLQRVGSSSNELFILQALKIGHSRIRFIQKRPWEPNQLPLKEHILEVNIYQ